MTTDTLTLLATGLMVLAGAVLFLVDAALHPDSALTFAPIDNDPRSFSDGPHACPDCGGDCTGWMAAIERTLAGGA